MKRLLYVILFATFTPFMFTGCATPESAATTTTWLTKNESVIRASVKLVRKVAVRYGVNDPAKAAQVNGQIDAVALQVSTLLATGQFDPDSVSAALKVEDPGVTTALDAVNLIYAAAYTELENRGQVQLAIIILKDIAEGLLPPKTVAADKNGQVRFYGLLMDGQR